jgi:PmbA protein
MEKLLEIARKFADQADIYYRAASNDTISFEDGKLKDIDSKMQSGYYLRIFKDGKLGTAYTQNLIDREELVRNARAALTGGVEGDFELPLTKIVPKLSASDPSLAGTSNTALVDECARVCAALGTKVKAQINVGAYRFMIQIRIINSRGTDLATNFTNYMSDAAVFFPGTYSSIMRIIWDKKFVPFGDDLVNYIADTYNRAQNVVSPSGGRMKVLFMPEALYALVWRLNEASGAKSVYEKVSPIRTKLGERIFSEKLTITDEALNDRWPGARAFDDEGTPCRNLPIIEKGILKNFYCDLNYARKLGITPTGNGYKAEIATKVVPSLDHLMIAPGEHSFAGLLKQMDRGVIVGGVLGAHSGNILNGDYSIGLAPGLWVENGEIQGQVKDSMVAGNIYETMKNVVAVENRQYPAQMGAFPAILFDDVSVATKS